MTKRELIEILAERVGSLNYKDAELIVNTIFDSMTEALAEGDRVEIRGFGSFHVRDYKAKTGRNPKTGEQVKVEKKRAPHFKVGKELKERVF